MKVVSKESLCLSLHFDKLFRTSPAYGAPSTVWSDRLILRPVPAFAGIVDGATSAAPSPGYAGTATGNGPQDAGGAGAAEMGDDIQVRVVAVAAESYISKQQLLIRHPNHCLHRSPQSVHDIR